MRMDREVMSSSDLIITTSMVQSQKERARDGQGQTTEPEPETQGQSQTQNQRDTERHRDRARHREPELQKHHTAVCWRTASANCLIEVTQPL